MSAVVGSYIVFVCLSGFDDVIWNNWIIVNADKSVPFLSCMILCAAGMTLIKYELLALSLMAHTSPAGGADTLKCSFSQLPLPESISQTWKCCVR